MALGEGEYETLGNYLVHPAAQLFPLIEGEEYERLREDIRENGQLEPIWLVKRDEGTFLIDGRNRLRCLIELSVKPECEWYEGPDIIGFVLSKNLHRRHLNESQRGMVGASLKELYEQEARKAAENQESPAPAKDWSPLKPVEGEKSDDGARGPIGPRVTTGRLRDKAAEAVNVGSRTVARADKVRKDGIPELVQMVQQGRLKVDIAEQVARKPPEEQREILRKIEEGLKKNPKSIVRRHDKDKVITKIRMEPKPLPEGPFRVIMADPAWMYEKRKDDGTQRGQTEYPTMTVKEICDLGEQVKRVAHINCVLWLWITNAHLLQGVHVEVLAAWGFTPKTMVTWRKPKMGTGDWLRGKTEHCILATRGMPVVDLTNQTTDFSIEGDGELEGWYIEAPVAGHSEKPDEFYEFAESLCPGAKLEMFSRKDRPGWMAWGAESGSRNQEVTAEPAAE